MPAHPGTRVDVDAYLARIDYRGALTPSPQVLSALHLAHATHIPFSTLGALMGPPTPLDLGLIQNKLVHEQRGGFCVEHHLLFSAVLTQIGFPVSFLAANVRNAGPTVLPTSVPRPHLLLSVEAGDQPWLVDVCFGEGPVEPLPLRPGVVTNQFGWAFRLSIGEHSHILWSRQGGTWVDLYDFALLPRAFSDVVVLHHFGTTHPDSILLNHFWAHRHGTTSRWTFWVDEAGNGILIERRADNRAKRRRIAGDEQHRVLADHLGIRLPSGYQLPKPPVRLGVRR